MSTRVENFLGYLGALVLLASILFWAQTQEAENPRLAIGLMGTAISLGFATLGYCGVRMIQTGSMGRPVMSALATLAMPVIVEYFLQLNAVPIDVHGMVIVVVVFYWTMSVVVSMMVVLGAFIYPIMERRNNTISHLEIPE